MEKIKITSGASEANKVHDALIPKVAACGYSDEAQFAIRLAVDEALANAIWHGCKSDPGCTIEVSFDVTDESVRIHVCDDGPGFDPVRIPDPTLDENLNKPNGRGIMLMRAYMSEVSYNRRGNCVKLIKQRDCTRPDRSGGGTDP